MASAAPNQAAILRRPREWSFDGAVAPQDRDRRLERARDKNAREHGPPDSSES
jgi:hypothetical protein